MKTQEVGFHSVGENDAASGTRERSVKGSAYTSVACGVRTGNGSPMSIALHPTRWSDRLICCTGSPWTALANAIPPVTTLFSQAVEPSPVDTITPEDDCHSARDIVERRSVVCVAR